MTKQPAIKSVLLEAQTLPQDICLKLQILGFASRFLLRYTHNVPDTRTSTPLSQSQHGCHNPTGKTTATDLKIRQVRSSLITDTIPAEANQSELDSNYLSMLQQLKIPPSNACPRRRLLPLFNIIREFIAICTCAASKVSETPWFNITGQLVMHGIIEEIRVSGNLSSEDLGTRLAWAPDASKEPKWTRNLFNYMDYLQPPAGVHPRIHLEGISNEFPFFQLEGILIDFLFSLMKKLDPPVLVQLERGKLNGMTRAETQMLKRRVGFV